MPRYNLLYTVEVDTTDNKTDCRLIVLYDTTEETYYYYGTRSRTIGRVPLSTKYIEFSGDKYIEFSGAYPETKLVTFCSFFKYLNNMFDCKMNIELHNIELLENEYETLTFTKLLGKLSRYTELFAYDNIRQTEGSILEKLDMLTTNID